MTRKTSSLDLSVHTKHIYLVVYPTDVLQKALELNELKSRTFNHGIQKKTKKDLEREAEERKKREDEESVMNRQALDTG